MLRSAMGPLFLPLPPSSSLLYSCCCPTYCCPHSVYRAFKPFGEEKAGPSLLMAGTDRCSICTKIQHPLKLLLSLNPNNYSLQDVSFHVAAGTSCALVGTSGSGKSTVLRLLYRSAWCEHHMRIHTVFVSCTLCHELVVSPFMLARHSFVLPDGTAQQKPAGWVL